MPIVIDIHLSVERAEYIVSIFCSSTSILSILGLTRSNSDSITASFSAFFTSWFKMAPSRGEVDSQKRMLFSFRISHFEYFRLW